jgi:hypothetical protein
VYKIHNFLHFADIFLQADQSTFSHRYKSICTFKYYILLLIYLLALRRAYIFRVFFTVLHYTFLYNDDINAKRWEVFKNVTSSRKAQSEG